VRTLPFLVFIAVIVLILGSMHYYLWARLVRDPQLPALATRLLTAAMLGFALVLPASLVTVRLSRGHVAPAFVWMAFLWMGIGFLLAAFLAFADVGRFALWAARRLRGNDVPVDPARRTFLARVLAVGVSGTVLGLAGEGVRSALGRLRVKEVPIRLDGLPAQLDGFRLVQISDLHIGALLHRGWVEGVVERVLGTRPDAVAITGDLVDGSVDELRNHVAPLAALASAPRGVFFVTGNHEYYSGVDDWLRHLPSLGIRPLRNERVELAPGLDLAGIHDPSGYGTRGFAPDLDRALAGRQQGRPVVLLAHQPRQFEEAARKGVALTLCGHTHGGQIWPFSWIVAIVQPYLAGLHRIGNSQVYVSRGTGFWGPPMRVFAPPEITVLTLHRA
jgi:predicted MPP superfamily phosphohydrolase